MDAELLQRYLVAVPEGSRVALYEKGMKKVIAIVRTPYSRVKYYDKYSFETFGELIPVEPDVELKWEDMGDTDFARKRWQEGITKLMAD